jgi:hypothetical protein
MKSLNDEWEKNQITDELLYYCFQCQIAFLSKNATNATFLIKRQISMELFKIKLLKHNKL